MIIYRYALISLLICSCRKPSEQVGTEQKPALTEGKQDEAASPTSIVRFGITVKDNVSVIGERDTKVSPLRVGNIVRLRQPYIPGKMIRVILPETDASLPAEAIKFFKPTNEYDPANPEHSAIQAVVHIFDLERQIGEKLMDKPTDLKTCTQHFEQGYTLEIARGFADHWCKPYGSIMQPTDMFLDGPLERVKIIRKIDADTVVLCTQTFEMQSRETAINTLRRHEKLWKIVKGTTTQC